MPHSAPTPPPPSVCPTRLITSARIPSFLFTQHHRKACQLFTHARTRSHAYAGEKKSPQMRGMLSSATYKHKINLYNLICHENTHICKYRAANRLPPPPPVPHTDTHPHSAIWPGPVPPVGKFEECVVRYAHTSSRRLKFALVGTVGALGE